MPRTSISEYNKTFRASLCVHSACHRSNNAKINDLYTTVRTSTVYNKAFMASWCVHSAHGVCVLQNTLVVYWDSTIVL